ncbi:MAG: LPS export ABC transporter periplasmic protein LptC [Nitrospiraceae bacterium]|nr:LPS export ABC transporter periplasmic protein LptC [Nitrospiraceae bacterium]
MKSIVWRICSLLSVLAILAVLLYGSNRLLDVTESGAPILARPDAGKRLLISMEGFRFAQTEEGRVPWRMSASNADLYENKEARLKNIEIVFTTPEGKRAALIGEQGTLDTRNGDARIRRGSRDVRIVSSEGYLMTTDSLAWKAGQREVTTPDAFKVLGRDIYFEGKGFSAEVDMRKLSVDSNVKAILQE